MATPHGAGRWHIERRFRALARKCAALADRLDALERC